VLWTSFKTDCWHYSDTLFEIIIVIIIIIMQKLGRKTWELLTIHGHHHPKADIDRLYVPREQGGRDLMQLEEAYTVEITKPVECAGSKQYPLMQISRTHKHINSTVLQTPQDRITERNKTK
jgi:hypothetical protein